MSGGIEDRLRQTAGVFHDGGPGTGLPSAPSDQLTEIRQRSGIRRRNRRRVVSGLTAVLVLVGVAGVLRLPNSRDRGGVGLVGDPSASVAPDGETPDPEAPPSTTTGTALASPATSPPDSSPAGPVTTTTLAGPVSPNLNTPTTPTTRTGGAVPAPAPVGGPVTFAADGLGVIRFGDDVTPAINALTAALGPYKGPAQPGGYGSAACGVVTSLAYQWEDLTVYFNDRGQGLRFAGYHYGAGRGGAGHAAPSAPGRPIVGNPWGLVIGSATPAADALLGQVQRTYPSASLGPQMGGIYDRIILIPLADTYQANIDLHEMPDGSLRLERFLVWRMSDRGC